jgi:hypothetical protein
MSSEIPVAGTAAEQDGTDHGQISYDLDGAEEVTDRPKPRIRRAIKNGDLIARRDGRRLIIEADELRRWIRSLPLASSI